MTEETKPSASRDFAEAVKADPHAHYPGKPARKGDPLAEAKHKAFLAGHPIAKTP